MKRRTERTPPYLMRRPNPVETKPERGPNVNLFNMGNLMPSIVDLQFTKVEVRIGVTVSHFHLPAGIDVEHLAADLNAEFEKFDGFVECASSADVVRQAIEINATFGKLLDAIQLAHFASEIAYSEELLKALQTGSAILARYESDDAQRVGLGYVARDRLSKRIADFYRKSEAPRVITSGWLWDLQFYDYLIANDLLDGQHRNARWGAKQPIFSPGEHKEFLQRHAREIHLRMAETAFNGRYYVPDPLSDRAVQGYFKAYRIQRSFLKDAGSEPGQPQLS